MPIEDQNGQPVAYVGIDVDVTERKQAENQLRIAHSALEQANRKMSLLSSITRHDILNSITVLVGMIDLKLTRSEPDIARRLLRITDSIKRQIEFTQQYEEMGLKAPAWQDLEDVWHRAIHGFDDGSIKMTSDVKGVQIFADQMVVKVFRNLIDNTFRHGGSRVSQITLTHEVSDIGLVLRYKDDGVGVPVSDKDYIFERGVGKHTGFGLFLTREILGLTHIDIREVGMEGQGAIFELLVPTTAWRMRP